MSRYGPGTDCRPPAPQYEPALSCSNQHTIAQTLVLAFVNDMLRGDRQAADTLIGSHGPLAVTTER
jgi:hypothetical protein